jgi:alanine-glyoxylate transaminase/(R)-3-amino-2-methylpropionate-pyruvate transaminase
VSCAGGRAVLDVIDRERLQDNCARVGGHLLNELDRLKQKHDGEARAYS